MKLHSLTLAIITALSLSACAGGDDNVDTATANGDTDTCMESMPSLEEMGIEDGLFVASSMDFEPFEYQADGEPTGFDIDLLDKIKGRMCVEEMELTNLAFDSLLPQVDAGQYDLAVSGITITDERQENFDFSVPYFESDLSLLVGKDSGITSLADLNSDHLIALAAATTGETWAQENVAEAELRSYATSGDGYQALKSGQVDGVINDRSTSHKQETLGNGVIVEEIETGEQYGIVAKQGREELLKGVNLALADIITSGDYEEIYAKYFDGPVPEKFASK